MNKINELFGQTVKVVNVGLPTFAEDLRRQGVAVRHVEWKPPAGGNKKVLDLLSRIKKSQNPKPL